jgi:hypothetical protein
VAQDTKQARELDLGKILTRRELFDHAFPN